MLRCLLSLCIILFPFCHKPNGRGREEGDDSRAAPAVGSEAAGSGPSTTSLSPRPSPSWKWLMARITPTSPRSSGKLKAAEPLPLAGFYSACEGLKHLRSCAAWRSHGADACCTPILPSPIHPQRPYFVQPGVRLILDAGFFLRAHGMVSHLTQLRLLFPSCL